MRNRKFTVDTEPLKKYGYEKRHPIKTHRQHNNLASCDMNVLEFQTKKPVHSSTNKPFDHRLDIAEQICCRLEDASMTEAERLISLRRLKVLLRGLKAAYHFPTEIIES